MKIRIWHSTNLEKCYKYRKNSWSSEKRIWYLWYDTKKAHEKITQAGNDIDSQVGTRTIAINRSLREVNTYSGEDAQKLLGIGPESVSINKQSTYHDIFEDDVWCISFNFKK